MESVKEQTVKSEYVFLQLLRAIAAMGVMCYHHFDAVSAADIGWPARIAAYGDLGVIIFFVVSGYVISISADSRAEVPRTFFFQRTSRIYPPYLTSIALAVLLAVISTFLTGKALSTQVPVSAAAYVKNILLIENLFPGGDYISTVYWSLCYEMQFYLVVTLALFLFRRKWILVCLTVSLVLIFLYPFHDWMYLKNSAYFGLGIIVFMIHKGSAVSSLRWILYGSLLYSSIAIFPSTDTRLAAAACTAWMILFFKPADRFFTGRLFGPFYFIGKISYSLYLTHPQTGIRLVNLLMRWFSPSSVMALIAVCAGCLFSAGFAYLFYRYTEQYLCRIVRKYLKVFF